MIQAPASAGVSLEAWLAAHEFLAPVARFDEAVTRALDAGPAPQPTPEPDWVAYLSDFHDGVPLLSSVGAGVPATAAVSALLRPLALRLASGAGIPEKLRADCGLISGRWIADPSALERTARFIVTGEKGKPLEQAGLLRYLGWRAASRALERTLAAFADWRAFAGWGRAHCPACGALPMMSWLVPGEGVRERQHSCGCCGTSWAAERIGCAYCGNADADKLSILEAEGQGGLRLDLCEACRGYTKTWAGEGDPAVLLLDWTSLHLDLIAIGRGYVRKGVSLFEL